MLAFLALLSCLLCVLCFCLPRMYVTPVPWGPGKKSAGCAGSCTKFTDSCSARQNPYFVFLQRLISKKYIETDLGAGVKRLHTLFNLYYSQIETCRSVVAVVHRRPWTTIYTIVQSKYSLHTHHAWRTVNVSRQAYCLEL